MNSYRNNPQVKAKYKLQLSLNKLIRAKSCCENIYGCSVEFLFKHIESQFREGMTWGNYGVGKGKWCIDHILPCKHFNLLEQIDVKNVFIIVI